MELKIEIGIPGRANRAAHVVMRADELRTAWLSVAAAPERNRSGAYMRRHPKCSDKTAGIVVDANHPLRSPLDPPKVSIPEHLEALRSAHPSSFEPQSGGGNGAERFLTQHSTLAVPVSDVVANLMRPCFSRGGLGRYRSFFFEDEPIDQRSYWALCYYELAGSDPTLRFAEVRFDVSADTVLGPGGDDLAKNGLQWAAALVPLVKNGEAVPVLEIARSDYDLRQIFGRFAEEEIRSAYSGWWADWDSLLASLVAKHAAASRPFEVFYHSAIALDADGAIHIFQEDATLPELAQRLCDMGMVSAGLLDSGGSCALFDGWLNGYLNHGWYFRERRGAVFVFQLKGVDRIPESRLGCWYEARGRPVS